MPVAGPGRDPRGPAGPNPANPAATGGASLFRLGVRVRAVARDLPTDFFYGLVWSIRTFTNRVVCLRCELTEHDMRHETTKYITAR